MKLILSKTSDENRGGVAGVATLAYYCLMQFDTIEVIRKHEFTVLSHKS